MSETSELNEKICLGVLPANEGTRLKSLLATKDIEIVLLFNHATCTSGCRGSGTVELWAHKNDLDEIVKTFSVEKLRLLDGLEFDPEIINQVYDPSQEAAICPACGTKFSTSLGECPDCGLGFSLPKSAENPDGQS